MNIVIDGNSISVGGDCSNIQIRNGEVIVDGESVGNAGKGKVEIYGNVGNIQCDKSVNVNNGEVKGNVDAKGSVNCDDVNGFVNAGGSVNCDRVGQDVTAGGSVRCDEVGGDINAGGSVRC